MITMTTRNTSFKDTSTECAICLTSFKNTETIELACGHRWHLECIKDQLEHAQPNHARRILFSGCRCAKCGVFCEHESLNHLTRCTDALRDKVDALIREQLQIDAPQEWRQTSDKARLMEEGRRKYAFYLCNSCEKPYFGGTIECADQEEGELPNDDRLCPTCAPQPQSLCHHPHDHKGCHVWKCRYCCNPSNYVCYGTVHFCQACHDRNSQRVRQQRRGTTGPPPLEPIPCSGNSCAYPKAPGQDRHANGASHTCEQVYYCAICISSSSPQAALAPGSRNFIRNASGQEGLLGWKNFTRNMMWQVETSEIPASATATTNFVSSFHWCVMGQKVPLHRLVRDPSSVRFEVSAKYLGRTDCPSVFQMEAVVLDQEQREIHRVNTGLLDAPADFWERASLILGPIRGTHDIVVIVYGKDKRFWRGLYGSKVAECSLRVLCSEEELSTILLPEALEPAEAGLQPSPIIQFFLPFLILVFVWLLSG